MISDLSADEFDGYVDSDYYCEVDGEGCEGDTECVQVIEMDVVGSEGEQQFTPAVLQDARQHCQGDQSLHTSHNQHTHHSSTLMCSSGLTRSSTGTSLRSFWL